MSRSNTYRASQSDTDITEMTKARSEYKSAIRTCKYRQDKQNTIKLENARLRNAKLYWAMLNE